MSAVAEWPSIDGGLPDPPDEALWPFLDAACRAVERFGWARTTMRDIAREAGVERTTIYRHVGLDVRRLPADGRARTPQAGAHHPRAVSLRAPMVRAIVVELVAAAVEYCLDHPVLTKVVTDEPELVSSFLVDGVPSIIDRLSELLDPTVEAAMEAGLLARRDPTCRHPMGRAHRAHRCWSPRRRETSARSSTPSFDLSLEPPPT